MATFIEDAILNNQELFFLFSKLRTFDIMALKKYYISTFKENPVLDALNRYVMTKNNTEKTLLRIRYSTTIIESNVYLPEIFRIFNIYNKKIFVIDFDSKNFFWLNDEIKKIELTKKR